MTYNFGSILQNSNLEYGSSMYLDGSRMSLIYFPLNSTSTIVLQLVLLVYLPNICPSLVLNSSLNRLSVKVIVSVLLYYANFSIK